MTPAPPTTPTTPTTRVTSDAPGSQRVILCPYCGHQQSVESGDTTQSEACGACRGLMDPLSRQATQNQMGPWFIRNEKNPFSPGMSYDRIRQMAARGAIRPDTVLRGPSTRQFWTFARHAPGVASLIGECHNCHAPTEPDEYLCRACGVILSWSSERQHLGLSPIKLLPGDAPPAEVASSGMGGRESRPSHPTPTRASTPPSSGRETGYLPLPAVPPASPPRTPTGVPVPEGRHPAAIRARSTPRPPRRLDPAALTLLAVGTVSAVVVVGTLVAVFGFGLGVPHDRVPASPPAAPASAPNLESPPPQTPSPSADPKDDQTPAGAPRAWLDEALRPRLGPWWDSLEQARELGLSEESGKVNEALAIVERVLAEAKAAGAAAPEVIAALETQARSLRVRADAVRLRELLKDPPAPSP